MMESYAATKSRFLDCHSLIYGATPPFKDVPITRNGLFELAACVGKSVRPTDIDQLWPVGRESLNEEEAFEVFVELEEIQLPKTQLLGMPTERLMHRLQRMDLPGDDRFFMEKYWKQFTDEKGEFEIERFARVLADDREVFLDEQDDLRAFWQERALRAAAKARGEVAFISESSQSPSERSQESSGKRHHSKEKPQAPKESGYIPILNEAPARPASIQESPIREDPLADGKSSSGCGFLSLAGGSKHCVGVYFTVTTPTLFNLSFRVKRHSHIPEELFKYDVIGYVKNEDTGEIVAVTTRVYRHEEEGETFKKHEEDEISAYQPSKFVNDDGVMTAHFRVLLYDIFDVFDINMNKLLEKSEFDLFTHLSENNFKDGGAYMTDEEWSKLANIFEFDAKKGMPLKAFIAMFKAEVIAGPEALNDIAVNMRNIGVNPKFEQDRMCPYKLHVSSVEKQQLRSQLFDVQSDSIESLPFHFFDRGEELMELDVSTKRLEYSLNWRLFRAKYFAVLVSRSIAESVAPLYIIDIKSEGNNVNIFWNEEVSNGYRNCKHAKRVIVATMFPVEDRFSFEVQLTKRAAK